jgi:hypothetical protein
MKNRVQRRKAKVPGQKTPAPLLKLDLGCGAAKKEGFIGVDSRKFPGVDQVVNLAEAIESGLFGSPVYKAWPWKDGSVEEVHCSHFVEHLTAPERIHFVNELYRVLSPEGKATVITPHWASCRAYGDLTHQWPPVSEMWFCYLLKAWRDTQAPHNDAYTCDFDVTYGFTLHPALQARAEDYRQHAVANFKEAAQDIMATFKKRPPAQG